MAQPQWITPAGSLGVIPEGVFYSVGIQAVADGEDVKFRLIAGELPDGVQVTPIGIIEGVPKNVARVQGVPQEVSVDTTSRFAIRAFTTRVVNGRIVVDRLADRTFTLTITGQDVPEFVTPPGNIGTFYDGDPAKIQIEFTDTDPDETLTIRRLTGELPPGLVLDPRTGLISGVIAPLVGPPDTAQAGYDATAYDQYPFDFSTRSTSKNFQFSLEITDGKDANVRSFEIFVYSKDSMTADTTDFTADNTFITADVVPTRTPVLLTPPGDLGIVRADNFYAFKFDGFDFDGDPIEYSVTTGAGIGFDSGLTPGSPGSYDVDGFDRGAFSLPPGLVINPDTGWFYGYIPDQGATQQTYKFAIQVRKKIDPYELYNPLLTYPAGSLVEYLGVNYQALIDVNPGIFPTNTTYWVQEFIPASRFYFFTITIIGQIDTDAVWLTDPDLGSINNGAISTFQVQAENRGGRDIQYRILPGSNSRLPQGLTLQPSGNITGRVSFNTFALDGGTTTFDKNLDTRLDINETTFDLTYRFTVNAFAPQTEQLGFQVGGIRVTNGGSGYTSQPTISISAPPGTEDSIQATAGVATIVGGVITAISVGNPGRGYLTPPTITIIGGGGSGATATANMIQATSTNAISILRTFTITVNRAFNQPYESLYIKCMPPRQDRALIDALIQNQDIIPVERLYRPDDPNFGVAKNVTYYHAYGLPASSIESYVQSLSINHYWKNLTLGQIETARALDANGNVLYEVVYSRVIDDLVNDQGESVGKSVRLPYPVEVDGSQINTVYPNSLINMRDQVVDSVGQVTPGLPQWMISQQPDGRVLGFVTAWVIAYVKPGESGRVAYDIRTQFGDQLNKIDFKVDRYELDRSQTYNWEPYDDSSLQGRWIPSPPEATVFDAGTTVFDGGSTRFIAPADRWEPTDAYDKYLVFPRTNILN